MNVQKFGSRLQQQPARGGDWRQQQAGSTDFQSRPSAQQGDEGEGSFRERRDYHPPFSAYLSRADLQKRPDGSRPRSEREVRELAAAQYERLQRSYTER